MIRKIKVVQNPKLFQVKLEYNHLEQIAGLCDEAAVFFVTKKLSARPMTGNMKSILQKA